MFVQQFGNNGSYLIKLNHLVFECTVILINQTLNKDRKKRFFHQPSIFQCIMNFQQKLTRYEHFLDRYSFDNKERLIT